MALEIPLAPGVASYDLRADLGDSDESKAEYQIRMRYADRLGVWLMDFLDEDGDAIFSGASCLLNVRLLKGNTHESRPPGDLVFVATSSGGTEATLEDMGDRVQLIYMTADEVAELEAS
jgi:hypothetical protein